MVHLIRRLRRHLPLTLMRGEGKTLISLLYLNIPLETALYLCYTEPINKKFHFGGKTNESLRNSAPLFNGLFQMRRVFSV
jgi:hypothetical protein